LSLDDCLVDPELLGQERARHGAKSVPRPASYPQSFPYLG
jgi:hypothetical protein